MEIANVKNTLQVMLKSPINSQKFIESKVVIQNELHVLATENTGPGFGNYVNTVYNTWRLLGGNDGTIDGYLAAIDQLKNFITDFEISFPKAEKS